MLRMKDILREGNEKLKLKSTDVNINLDDETKKTITDLMQYVILSQNEESQKEFELRAAVGIAAPQIGINKNIFAVVIEEENLKFSYVFVNPKIIEKSKEMIYLDNGEGCLSVDRQTEGVVLRHLSITIKSQVYDFKTKKLKNVNLKLTGYPSIVFQHEYDHLDGILFTDKIVEKTDKIDAISLSEFENQS